MPIDLPQAHHNCYNEKHYLELEGFFPEDKLEAWRKSLGSYSTFDEAYLSGRDLWRKNPKIKQLITNRDLVQCVSKLSKTPSLQIGFDQTICTYDENTSKLPLAKQPVTLTQISNVSGIACGAIINLSRANSPHTLEQAPPPSEELTPMIPIPHAPGSVLFISPELPLDFEKLIATPSQTLLLIVYTHVKPLYIQNALDPHANALKKLGYGFGDHLKENSHPLLNL